MLKKLGLAAAIAVSCSLGQLALAQERTVFVHLFEWGWNDIAQECEQHLGPKGFAAVQVSPPQESIVRGEWWSRYQPVSYAITGRSGSRSEFQGMVNRCKAVGVDIYVDAVINHMAALDRNYPEVPFGANDFNDCARDISDYGNRDEVQFCDLVGLNDLKTGSEYVRQKIADYMNDLIGMGVAGFRIDASKHIPSQDLAAIKSKLNQNVYLFQEVIGAPGEPVQPNEYTQNGDVTEFNYERTLGHYFKGRGPLKDLQGLRNFQGWLPSEQAVVFVSNHDDQRQNTANTLTYKDQSGLYYIGEIFSLAYPYGYPKVMSSYRFEDHDQGPPTNGANSGDACGVSWVCEHRWRGVANMVEFRNATSRRFELSNWWDNGNNQIAFGRGDLGFVVINREEGTSLNQILQTGMAAGSYCDIVNGDFDKTNSTCDGPTIIVNSDGSANFDVGFFNAAAIHVNAKLGDGVIVDPVEDQVWADAYFRGTANSWGATAMTFSNGLWRTTQSFGENNPRFKISRYQNWSEAYPNQDFLISEPGTYDISINDRTQVIMAAKQVADGVKEDSVVSITFECSNANTQVGQAVYAVGNIASLGNWNPENAIKLNPVYYPVWSKSISLNSNQSVKWKCLKRSEVNATQNIEWQGGENNLILTDSEQISNGRF